MTPAEQDRNERERYPERVLLPYHRECGSRIGSDGWCDHCRRSPDLDEYENVEYVRRTVGGAEPDELQR